jgi:hypothetical protein
MRLRRSERRFGPIATFCTAANSILFDHVVSERSAKNAVTA